MTLYTSPDGLPVPEDTDPIAPLNETLEDISVGTQAALLRPGAVASAAARDAAIPNPVQGQSVWRTDMQWREVYMTTPYVRTNGWYPIFGALPGVYAKTAAAMSVSASTATPLKFTQTDLQRGITYNLSTGKATITVPGLYLIEGGARPSTVNADNRVYVSVNSESTFAIQQAVPSSVGIAAVSATRPLSVGDVVSVDYLTGTAQTLNTNQRFVGITYLGPA